ncbi:MAG TPA: guanylate kinase [Acidimicrobiales bacterium]|nr:guanylate kinase [Acidimicrobiales bacterium]
MNGRGTSSLIFILSGPGGVGKGTVVARLLGLLPGLTLSRSWTTRQRRPGEAEDAYVFVDRETFLARVDRSGFLEWTEFAGNGHLYGTPVPELDAPGDLLLEIELDGAQQVKKLAREAVLVFVVPPSRKDWEARLRGRGDDEDSIRRRLEVGEREVELGTRLADHVVVNDDVDRAAAEVADIITSRRERRL